MEAVIGGAFGFAGSALSQMAEGHGFNARKAWGAAANGAIVGAARGALIGSGAGIPLAFGVDFAAGMAGSLAEQKISGARIAPVRAAVDGAFNAAGGRLYGTSPLKNVKNAFMRGALEGAVKGGAYNIADVLDNRLRNAYNARKRQKLRTTGKRNTWNKKNKNPWNSRNPRPTGSRSPQSHCGRPKPLRGMRNPKRRRSSRDRRDRAYHALPNDRFRIRSFVRDVVAGAVMGGLASASFYGAGKAVEALKRGLHRRHIPKQNQLIAHEQNSLIELDLQYFAQKNSITRVRHYTNSKGLNGIRQSGVIYARDNNRVYLEPAKRKPMSIADAEEFYELKEGRGRNYVEFDVDSSELEWVENPRYHRLELTVKGDVTIENPKFFKRRK